MNCQPGDAQLDSIQHQQLGGSLMNAVVERFNFCDEESLEEFRCDPKTSTDEKLSSNKDKEEPTLAFRPGPVDEDKKHTEDETEYVVSCEYCKKEFGKKQISIETYKMENCLTLIILYTCINFREVDILLAQLLRK